MYYGHAKTESLLVEATQALSDFQLFTVPGGLTQPRRRYDAKLPNLLTDLQESYVDDTGSNVWSPDRQSPIVTTGGSFFPPYASQSQPSSPFSYAPPHQGAVDEFGILPTRSSGSGPIDIGGGGGGGGRFATFPVKTREGGVGYTLRDEPLSSSAGAGTNTNANAREQQQQPSLTTTTQPPSLNTNTRHELDVSFSMSVAEALNSGGGVEDQPWARTTSDSGPTPTSAIQPLPPGAAPALPEGDNPWSLPPLGGAGSGLGRGEGGGLLGLGSTPGQTLGGKQGRHVSNQSIVSDDDDALLAYMLNADVDDGEDLAGGRGRGDRRSLAAAQPAVTATSQPAATSTTQPAIATPANGLTTQGNNGSMDEDRERGQSRHVRFGGSGHASESGEAEEWRRSLEERRSDAHASTAPPGRGEVDSEKGSSRLFSSRC